MSSALTRIGRSFIFRLTAWYTLLLLASSAALLGTVYVHLRGVTLSRERDSIESRLRLYESLHLRGGEDELRVLADAAARRPVPTFFVQLADTGNRTVFVSHEEVWSQFRPRTLDDLPPPAEEDETVWSELGEGRSGLVLASRRLGDGYVLRVGRSKDESRRVLYSYWRFALVCLALALPIGVAGGILLSNRMLAPVRTLTGRVRGILDSGRAEARLPASAGFAELDELVEHFNRLLDRIGKLMNGISESLDYAAHDLRTPLTRLYNSAQDALRRGRDPEAMAAALADCVEEAEHLLSTVRRFSDVAEAEAGIVNLDRKPVDLAGVLADVADMYEEIAEEKDVSIRVAAPGPAVALVDRPAMRRVVANLVDNALKYAPAGSEVTVGARRDGATVELRVVDRGRGIPEDELPLIWQRLYRGSGETPGPGAGLGLSIVKAVVDAHGGSVRADSGGETVFTVRLPAA